MGKEKKKNGKHEQYRNYWQHQWEASGAMSATLLQARSCAGHRDYRWLNLSSCRHEAQRYYNRLGSVRVLYGQLANIYQGQWAATILSSHHRLATGTCETTMDIAPSLPLRGSHPETEIRWAIYMEEQSSGNVKSSVREASSSQPATAEGAQHEEECRHQVVLCWQDELVRCWQSGSSAT